MMMAHLNGGTTHGTRPSRNQNSLAVLIAQLIVQGHIGSHGGHRKGSSISE